MKRTVFFFFLMIVSNQYLAQGPLGEGLTFPNSKELLISSFQANSEGSIVWSTELFDFDELSIEEVDSTGVAGLDFGSRMTQIVNGDFNDDQVEDCVILYSGANGNLHVVVPGLALENFDLETSSNELVFDANLAYNSDWVIQGMPAGCAGDFNGDGFQELAVAWFNESLNGVELATITFDENLVPSLLIDNSLIITGSIGQFEGLSMASGDLNNDNDQELMVAHTDLSDGDQPALSILDFTGVWEVTASEVITLPVGNYSDLNLAIAAGDTNGDGEPEAIIASSFFGCNGCVDSFVQVVDISTDLTSITFDPNLAIQAAWTADENSFYSAGPAPLTIQSFDMNFDDRDEVIVGEVAGCHIYEGTDNNALEELLFVFTGPGNPNDNTFLNSKSFLQIGDVNGDLEYEVLTLHDYSSSNDDQYEHYFVLKLYSVNPEDWTVSDGITLFDEYSQNDVEFYHYSIALTDVDGDEIILGAPEVSQYTEILQPLVVLNAPPIHFDKLGEEIFDVNGCFNGNECDFGSTYNWQTINTSTAQVQVKNSWNVSSSLEVGGEYGPLSIKTKIEQAQSGSITQFESTSESFQVTTQVVAKDDDLIYATVADYTAWEYPVFIAGELSGHVLFLEPENISNQWFPSKSWTGFSYTPDHEVGHILSYKEYPNSDSNPFSEESIDGTQLGGDGFSLNSSSDYSWQLQFSTFEENGVSEEKEIKTQVSAETGLFGFSGSISGSYSDGAISTHKTTVQQQLMLSSALGDIDLGIGETEYSIFPYSYWATTGALVLDYAAKPGTPQVGGTDTWWSENYDDLQDPGFILPWRLDPERGFTLQNPEKRYQSKHIQVIPRNPSPGDTVTLRAYINNFSLEPTQGPVKISFYLENPMNGGTLLADINGETIFDTGILLQARESKSVEMQWIYPSGLVYPKIYGFIDPQEEWTEIHETNNIGFTFLGELDLSTPHIEQTEETLTAYPNPAIDKCVIEFSLNSPSHVNLSVFDLQGKLMVHQVDQNLANGTYLTQVNVSDWEAGTYVYTISTNALQKSGKIQVIH